MTFKKTREGGGKGGVIKMKNKERVRKREGEKKRRVEWEKKKNVVPEMKMKKEDAHKKK